MSTQFELTIAELTFCCLQLGEISYFGNRATFRLCFIEHFALGIFISKFLLFLPIIPRMAHTDKEGLQ